MALFLVEGGSIGRPLDILSMVMSISWRRPTVTRNLSLLRDLYWILTLRVGRSAILRFDGTRPNHGVILSSRILCQMRPAMTCMAVGLSEFLISPTVHYCCRCRRWPTCLPCPPLFHQGRKYGENFVAVYVAGGREGPFPPLPTPYVCGGSDVFRILERRGAQDHRGNNLRFTSGIGVYDAFSAVSLGSSDHWFHIRKCRGPPSEGGGLSVGQDMIVWIGA